MVRRSNTLRPLASDAGYRTLADRAFGALREAIVTGVLKPGERLPIERLARELRVSAMPIREALRRLDSDGLVEHVPHRGARVRPLSPDELRELFEARLALEPLVLRHAAERFTKSDAQVARERLAAHVAASERADSFESRVTHRAFHRALYEAADASWLMRLIGPLWAASERYVAALLPVTRDLRRSRREHRRLLNACAANLPDEAAGALHEHLVGTANLLAGEMGIEPFFPHPARPHAHAARDGAGAKRGPRAASGAHRRP